MGDMSELFRRLPGFRLKHRAASVRKSAEQSPTKKESVFEHFDKAAEAAADVKTEFGHASETASKQASVIEGNIDDDVGKGQQKGFLNAGKPAQVATEGPVDGISQ